jgi:hypothetical protein
VLSGVTVLEKNPAGATASATAKGSAHKRVLVKAERRLSREVTKASARLRRWFELAARLACEMALETPAAGEELLRKRLKRRQIRAMRLKRASRRAVQEDLRALEMQVREYLFRIVFDTQNLGHGRNPPDEIAQWRDKFVAEDNKQRGNLNPDEAARERELLARAQPSVLLHRRAQIVL